MVRSLYSGVAGLTVHQTRMDVIGNNIANVNTYGFKSSRTSFSDIYYQAARNETSGAATTAGNNPSTVGYGVQVASIDKDMSASSFQNTNRTLDLAISGDGFFICGTLDRNAQISSVTYTRMGNFTLDSVGNLVNANNEFILGTVNTSRIDGGDYSSTIMDNLDPADTPTELDTININDLVWDAFKPECKIDFDDIPSKYRSVTTDAAGNEIQPTIFTGTDPSDTTRQIAYDRQELPEVVSNDDLEVPSTDVEVAEDYILYSVNGKYVNNQGVVFDADKGYYVDDNGNYYTYTCTSSRDEDGNITKTHTYTLMEKDEDGEPTDQATQTIYTYNAVNKSYETLDERGNTIYANMSDGSLQYADLESFSIGETGIITAQYASTLKSLARIELGTFNNIEGLREAGDTEFIQTSASGTVKIKRPGDSGAGEVSSSRLEMSNVNLASEFSDMIVTQRGFQANARIITTSDTMLEELVNLKR